MNIETKYSINDDLYFINNYKITIKKIVEITVSVNEKQMKIVYGYYKYCNTTMGSNPLSYINETNAFFTKEELLKSL